MSLHRLRPSLTSSHFDSLFLNFVKFQKYNGLSELFKDHKHRFCRIRSSRSSWLNSKHIFFIIFQLLSVTQNEHRSSSSESPAPVRHLRPTECSICGKTANGYHYDVPSCNGCKTFFRRLCISEKHFACKANGDCFDLTKRGKRCIISLTIPQKLQIEK